MNFVAKKLKYFFVITLFIILQSANAQWIKIGNTINGEAINDRFGQSVSLSADGNIVAISSIFHEGNGDNSGQVKVYELLNGSWIQKGNSILGSNAGDLMGLSMSLSENGNVLAIASPYNDIAANNAGKVEIFTFNGENWVLLGNTLTGTGEDDLFGISLALSKDASTISIGSLTNDSNEENVGQLSIFNLVDNTWSLLGSSINGTSSESLTGISTAINTDGTIICIGAKFNDEASENAGKLSVYEFQNNEWIQKGNTIFGSTSDELGSAVALNANGNILAVSSTENNNAKGQIKVFQFQDNDWIQLGSNINGINDSDRAGVSVSLSHSGLIIAIGADENDNNGNDAGHVRIFEYNGSRWVQLETDIEGEHAGDLAGISNCLNADGTRIAIGATQSDENGTDSGQCRVFELSNVGVSEIENSIKIFPNPTNKACTIISSDVKQIKVYNIDGKRIIQINNPEESEYIDLEHYESGTYIIKLIKEHEIISKKLVLHR